MIEKTKYRIGDLELRTVNKNLLIGGSNEVHTTCEIVRYLRNSCYTIANWDRGSCGYHLIETGNRMVGSDPISFFILYNAGQEILAKHFKETENDEL